MTVFQSIDAAFQKPALEFLERTATGLTAALADPMRAALTLYVLWFGILVLRGAVQEPIPEALARIIKASIITTLTLSYANYNEYVSSFFFDTLPRDIAAVVGGGTPASPGRFDQLLTRTNVLVEEMWRDAGWSYGLIKAAVVRRQRAPPGWFTRARAHELRAGVSNRRRPECLNLKRFAQAISTTILQPRAASIRTRRSKPTPLPNAPGASLAGRPC